MPNLMLILCPAWLITFFFFLPCYVFALQLFSLCVMWASVCVCVCAMSMSGYFIICIVSVEWKCQSKRACPSLNQPPNHTPEHLFTPYASHLTSQGRAPQIVFSPHSSRSLPCDLRNQLFPNGPRPVPQGPGEQSNTKAPSSSPNDVR